MFDNQSIYLILVIAFAYGIATGSFVTLVTYRLPRGQEIVFKPSYCPHCNHVLSLRDLVPLFSWLWQRGKCRYCHGPIHVRYPLIELTMGLAFVLLTYMYGANLHTVLLCTLVTELVILIVTDLEHFIIPDSIQIAIFITGIAYSFYLQRPVLEVLLGIGTGLAIGLALHYGYLYLRKKDALGWGDVKFMAMIGVWLPVHDFVTFFLLAGLIGTATGLMFQTARKGGIFPFAPALALSLLINVLYPDILGRLAS